MRLLFAIMICALCAVGVAQDWAKAKLEKSERHQEWVEVQNGSRKVKTFVVYPEVKEKAPTIVIIHEIMGLTDWVQLVADQFAAAGYIAIAPDLLSGMGPNGGRTDSFTDLSKVREGIMALPPDQITKDLDAVVDYGRKLPSANGKFAVTGFCWGGTQTFRYVTNRPDAAYGLVFYGSGPEDAAAIAKIKAPVYGFYGENDNRINATIPKSEELMKAAGKFYEPKIYSGAGHGFMRVGDMPDATGDNKTARDQAWAKLLELMAKLK